MNDQYLSNPDIYINIIFMFFFLFAACCFIGIGEFVVTTYLKRKEAKKSRMIKR